MNVIGSGIVGRAMPIYKEGLPGDLSVSLPSIKEDLVSAPSSSSDVKSVYENAQYVENSEYNDYLNMLRAASRIGLFSTAQDVVDEAQKDRLFQSAEAEKERKWYEALSDSSFQRQVADLEAAGLNPILGFSSGAGNGASTASTMVPSGRATNLSASAPNLADYINAGSNLINSAANILQYFVPRKYMAVFENIAKNPIGFGRS